jgi:uncharacterized membrane protein YfcA
MPHCSASILRERRVTLRLVAALTAAALAFAMLGAIVTIALHAEHEHDLDGAHGECSTCQLVNSACEFLRLLFTHAGRVTATAAIALTTAICLTNSAGARVSRSLIALKVRIND